MRKTLDDFEKSDGTYDYQAYADYLESPECTNDDGYDVIADQNGNVYTPTDGDWTKRHGHKNENTGYDRPADRKDSLGRPWKNPWLKYSEKLNLTPEESVFLNTLFSCDLNNQVNDFAENKTLSKRK